MTPDFTLLLVGGMVFAVAVLGFVGWRFDGPDTLARQNLVGCAV